MIRRAFLAALACAALPLASVPSLAAPDYPDAPVRFIVPFPPGGGTDNVSRVLAHGIAEDTGWNLVIENHAGAGGNIGISLVAKGKPNGLIIGMGQTSNLAINPTLYATVPYDAARDFTPVALVATQPTVLMVRAESPFHTLQDVIAAAKAKTGSLTIANSGVGTVSHLSAVLLAKVAGVKLLDVPYAGASPAITSLAGGQVDLSMSAPSSVAPLVKAGKLRALAVTSAQRLPILPEVPTVAESGYPGFEALDWKAVVAPAGTPADVVAALNAAVNKALTRQDVINALLADGSTVAGGTPERFGQFLASEQKRWGDTVRESGARVD
ncbi:MAG TPA: tripartite tricarboxylate transporter substrate binding protein [Bordetella sp.]